jgi:hypothetical protein
VSSPTEIGIVESLVFQFETTLGEVGETIAAIPDDEWKKGERGDLVPVRQVCHIIAGCDVYASEGLDKPFAWEDRLGAPVGLLHRALTPDELPDKQAVVDYLDETRGLVKTWLEGLTERQLCRPRRNKRERYNSHLGWVLYVLRHTVVHLGCLRAELKRRGIKYPEFR